MASSVLLAVRSCARVAAGGWHAGFSLAGRWIARPFASMLSAGSADGAVAGAHR
jgi:hypothetical protein